MTTNIDLAAEVIADALRPALSTADGIGHDLARVLATAGVLAPDLPKPTWGHADIWVVDDLEIEAIGDSVHLQWSDETDDMRGTTTRSLNLDRRMLLAILAAADHAEEADRADA